MPSDASGGATPSDIRTGGGTPFLGVPDHTRAALELGGAVVEHSDGAAIVVDREYRADMLHGRMPIGEIVSTITDGNDAMQLMAKAWPSAQGIGPGACCSSISIRPASLVVPARRHS